MDGGCGVVDYLNKIIVYYYSYTRTHTQASPRAEGQKLVITSQRAIRDVLPPAPPSAISSVAASLCRDVIAVAVPFVAVAFVAAGLEARKVKPGIIKDIVGLVIQHTDHKGGKQLLDF